ncbi:MAG TPA: hypothetical protein PLX58_05530 [Smithellaceae bacterium]|nr:hypothetical protein [Smithellaceae bacterium]HQF84415.1 hypothetical protein [Smithellaceae bacterium]HQG80282.1 hypothetical protein [Smithellaceae bacterium]
MRGTDSQTQVEMYSYIPIYAEATTALPLLASYAYHQGNWKKRKKWKLSEIF